MNFIRLIPIPNIIVPTNISGNTFFIQSAPSFFMILENIKFIMQMVNPPNTTVVQLSSTDLDNANAPITALTVAPLLEKNNGTLKPVRHKNVIVAIPPATKPEATLVPHMVLIRIVAVRIDKQFCNPYSNNSLIVLSGEVSFLLLLLITLIFIGCLLTIGKNS